MIKKYGVYLYEDIVQLSTQTSFETIRVREVFVNPDGEVIFIDENQQQHIIDDMYIKDLQELTNYLVLKSKEK